MSDERGKSDAKSSVISLLEVSKVYVEITGGLLSQLTYPAETVIAHYEAHVNQLIAETLQEEKLEALRAVAVAARRLAKANGADEICDDCHLIGHTAPCPWTALDAALAALGDDFYWEDEPTVTVVHEPAEEWCGYPITICSYCGVPWPCESAS